MTQHIKFFTLLHNISLQWRRAEAGRQEKKLRPLNFSLSEKFLPAENYFRKYKIWRIWEQKLRFRALTISFVLHARPNCFNADAAEQIRIRLLVVIAASRTSCDGSLDVAEPAGLEIGHGVSEIVSGECKER